MHTRSTGRVRRLTAVQRGLSSSVTPVTRRYEALWLDQSGNVQETGKIAPASPVFDDAFAALGRGTLLRTPDGPVAVEDLWPGTEVETVCHGFDRVCWVGSMTLLPSGPGGDGAHLFRIAADAFGPNRPTPDLVLGPRARMLYRHDRCRELVGTAEAFAPVRAFSDGISVIQVAPASPVKVYHIGFAGQRVVRANGIDVESYHPGLQAEAMMTGDLRRLFLSLFPHVADFDGFGLLPVPRLTAFELESLRAA